jgi:general secretion pathway protein G
MKRSGFTLIEVLVVIAIIGVLAGIILGLAGGAQQNAGRKRAEAEIAKLEVFVSEYQSQYGRVPGWGKSQPSTDAATKALKEALQKADHELKDLQDPWGDSYKYRPSSAVTFYLWSTGGEKGNSKKWIGEVDPDAN